MTTDQAHFDESWKEAMDLYFQPFLAFFFPEVHVLIAWDRPIEFLDKELERLIPESEIGRRVADKLVKVWKLNGEETFILIHCEIQSQEEKDFAERMFIYHYRIFDAYRKPVISLAVLGDERSSWRPNQFGYSLGGSQIQLNFPIVKLIDYEQRWAELEASDDPIAIMVMAHLRTKSTAGDPQSRKQWKWILTRRLFERWYSREDVIRLFRLIDWMMTLPPELKREFKQELDQFEEERKMPIISSVEEIAKEEGIQQGIEQEKQEVARNLLRLGMTLEIITQATGLTVEQVELLAQE
jgi:hypothetical protein